MKVEATQIPGVLMLEPRIYRDDRGFFLECWNRSTFRELGIEVTFVQDNHSYSRAGTLRGLHYQISRPQGKLVRVVRGTVFDVAVDLRRSSPTFGRWIGRTLSAKNMRMLWIPAGCAHGFYALSEADFLYKCSDLHDESAERTLLWNDPDLAIDWPLNPEGPLLISKKDQAGAAFHGTETYP